MIRGIHYFSKELKTKIDVIPRGCFNRLAIHMINDIMTHIPLCRIRCHSQHNVVLILAHHLRRWPSIKLKFCIKYTKPRFYVSESACASACASASSIQSQYFRYLLKIIYEHMCCDVQKPVGAVCFGSGTSSKSESGYYNS